MSLSGVVGWFLGCGAAVTELGSNMELCRDAVVVTRGRSLTAEQHVMGTLMHERLLSYNADVIYVWARAGNVCAIH